MQINLLIVAEIVIIIKFQHNRLYKQNGALENEFHTNDHVKGLPYDSTSLEECTDVNRTSAPLPTQDQPTFLTR